MRRTESGLKNDQTLASEIWENQCFIPDLYLAEGEEKTKAEAFLSWAKKGYRLEDCRRWWQHSNVAVWLQDQARPVDESWKKTRIDEMLAASSSRRWSSSRGLAPMTGGRHSFFSIRLSGRLVCSGV